MRTSAQTGSSAGRPVQRPAQRPTYIPTQIPERKPAQIPAQIPAQRRPQNGAQQSQTAVKKTTNKVVAGPDGRPVQVVETEEHIVKKTRWARVLTGATKAAKPTMKHTGKAVKRMIPALDRSGRNMSYYRDAFWRQDEQTRWDLYMSGAAPKMNMWDVRKLYSDPPRRFLNDYDLGSVMYATHVSPSGSRVPPTDLVKAAKKAKEDAKREAAEEEAAKLEAAAAKAEARKKRKKKKQGATTTATATTTAAGKAKAKVNTNAHQMNANPDALPFFATPENYITTLKVQVKPRPVNTARPQQHQPQQQQQQQQQQAPRPPQHPQPQTRLSTRPQPQYDPQPQRQTHQVPAARPQTQRPQAGHQPVHVSTAAATRQSYPVQGGVRPTTQAQAQAQAQPRVRQSVGVPVMAAAQGRGTGRRVAGQSVAGHGVAGSSRERERW